MSGKALAGYLRFGTPPCFLVPCFQALGDNALFVQTLDREYRILNFSEYEISPSDVWLERADLAEKRKVGDFGLLVVQMQDNEVLSGSVNELKDLLSQYQSSLKQFPFFRYETLKFLEREEEAANAIREAAMLFSDPIIRRNWVSREIEMLRRPNHDPEKHSEVSRLVESGSFAATHDAIATVTPFLDQLGGRDITRIAEALVSNNQIAWIYSDSDVTAFFSNFLSRYSYYLNPSILEAIQEMIKTSNDS